MIKIYGWTFSIFYWNNLKHVKQLSVDFIKLSFPHIAR